MISICIPIYNYDVTELVDELLHQAKSLKYPVEIMLFDDHSLSYYKQINSKLGTRDFVNYLEFDYNLGRSKIRNRLADFATGQWLLFLDCDLVIDSPDFLKKYIDVLTEAPVICGGIKYGKKPFREELFLRWKYGVSRENKSAARRQVKPHNSFMSGNFLISYDAYHKIRFNEEISGYGHEDTLFGIELKRNDVPVHHIDNPALHLGLEPCNDFLDKSEQGVINLVKLMRMSPVLRGELERSVRILRIFKYLRMVGLTIPLRWIFRVVNPIIKIRLCSKRPSLFLFDVYKLALLARLYTKGWISSISRYF